MSGAIPQRDEQTGTTWLLLTTKKKNSRANLELILKVF